MMNTVMTSAIMGMMLVGANARFSFGEYGGYGDAFGLYGEYGAYGFEDIMHTPVDPSTRPRSPSPTCGASCEFGDDVEDNEVDDTDDMDDMDDMDDSDDMDDVGTPAPVPASVGKPRAPPVKPAPVPNPTTETTTPTPAVPTTPPAGSNVDAETTRATPAANPADEGAAMSLSGSGILIAFSALAIGGAFLI